MKTVKEWLNDLEQPYKRQALNNLLYIKAGLRVSNICSALDFAFDWESSLEGFEYWQDLYLKLEESQCL